MQLSRIRLRLITISVAVSSGLDVIRQGIGRPSHRLTVVMMEPRLCYFYLNLAGLLVSWVPACLFL